MKIENLAQKRDEFIRDPRKSLWRLALPVMAGMGMQITYTLVDLYFVGKLPGSALAIMGFTMPIFFLVTSLLGGMGSGVTASIARWFGARDEGNTTSAAMHSLFLGLFLALGLTSVGFFAGERILYWMGTPSDLLPQTTSFLHVLLYPMGAMILSTFLRSILMGEGNVRIPMMILGVGTIANMILDPVFIFTLGYGVNGAAIATGISETIVLAALSWLLFAKKKTHIRMVFKGFTLSQPILYDIIKTGLPASLSMALVSIMHASMNGIIVSYSPLAVGAFQMGSRIDMFLFLPHIAISSSLMTLTGVFTGAKRSDLIKSTARYGMLASLFISVAGGTALYLAAVPIASAFTTDLEIRTLVVPYFKVLALTYPFVGLNVCAARALQGMGLGKPILITSFVRTIMVAIPLAYYFSKVLHLSIEWVWVAFAIARVLAMVISQVWFTVVMKRGEPATTLSALTTASKIVET